MDEMEYYEQTEWEYMDNIHSDLGDIVTLSAWLRDFGKSFEAIPLPSPPPAAAAEKISKILKLLYQADKLADEVAIMVEVEK